MAFFDFFKTSKQPEKRSFNFNFTPGSWLTSSNGFSPISVDEEAVMGIPAFSRGVTMIAKTISSLPIHLFYKDSNGNLEKVDNHPYLSLIKDYPNPYMTGETLRQTAQNHLLVYGNCYIKIARNNAGRPAELYLIHPNNIQLEIDSNTGNPVYKHNSSTGQKTYHHNQIIHIKGSSFDGLAGANPLRRYGRTFGIILAAETYGLKVFENGAATNYFITIPESYELLNEEQLSELSRSWASNYSGINNAGKVGVLPPGLDVKSFKVSADELQLLQTRQFHIAEIARILNIQAHLVGDMSNATFSNIEHQSIEYLQHTINPWLVAWEQTLNNYLLGPSMSGYFFQFNRDAVLRTDTKSRYEAHSIALNNGILSIDEVRAIENLNPLPNGLGADHHIQVNMAKVDTLPAQSEINNPTDNMQQPDNNSVI